LLAPGLHQDIERITVLIHGAPKVMVLALEGEHHLIHAIYPKASVAGDEVYWHISARI
jgi:hypothetical protein